MSQRVISEAELVLRVVGEMFLVVVQIDRI